MAYMCVYAHSHECDGCGLCDESFSDDRLDDYDELREEIEREERLTNERNIL